MLGDPDTGAIFSILPSLTLLLLYPPKQYLSQCYNILNIAQTLLLLPPRPIYSTVLHLQTDCYAVLVYYHKTTTLIQEHIFKVLQCFVLCFKRIFVLLESFALVVNCNIFQPMLCFPVLHNFQCHLEEFGVVLQRCIATTLQYFSMQAAPKRIFTVSGSRRSG